MRHWQGFSLIEGLIAIVVFSLGLLGLASVLLVTQRMSQTSKAETVAYTLAQDMSQRIVSNPLGSSTNVFIGDPVNCGSDTGCQNYSTLAASDIAAWQSEVTAQLPGATAVICRDDTPNDGSPGNTGCLSTSDVNIPYTIKIWWQTPDSAGPERYTQTFTVTS